MKGDYRLSKVQRNDVFQDAVTVGLIPADFMWTERDGNWQSRVHHVVHEPSGAWLTIDHFDRTGLSYYKLIYFPQSAPIGDAGKTWVTLKPQIRHWLVTVKGR